MFSMERKCLAIIPARGGSKGIPGKNTMGFCGKPLLAWSIEQAKSTRLISEVIVSSDDDQILDIAKQYGASCIKRPEVYASDSADLEGVLLHVLEKTRELQKMNVDTIVCLQPTSPLRQKDDLSGAINQFNREGADSLFSACKLEDACIWKEEDNQWESVTYDYRNRGRRQDREPLYLENGSIYIFTTEILKKYNNRLGGQKTVYMMPFWTSFEIDNKDDIPLCEFYMKRNVLQE